MVQRFNVDCVMSKFDAYKHVGCHVPIRLVQSPLKSIERKEKKYLTLCAANMHVPGSAFSLVGSIRFREHTTISQLKKLFYLEDVSFCVVELGN